MAVRVFVCIELPETVRTVLGRTVGQLRAMGGRVSWVRPGNIHLTLVFLGDVAEERVCDVLEAARASSEPHAPFEARLGAYGVFPARGRPRVLWAGVDEATGALDALAAAVRRELARFAFPLEDRRFVPHLTLGRVKDDRDPSVARVSESLLARSRESESFPVTQVTVMRSELRLDGPKYTPLGRAHLGGRRYEDATATYV